MKKISQLNLFRAFASRNYTLYFFGRAVSQFGTWMQRTAVVWVVYTLTHSAFLLGVTIFAEQFPSFLFSIPGGVAADRYNRYTIIKITQIISMVQAVLLAVLVLTGHTAVWAILLLSVLLGIINAFDVPARQALINDVVASPDDLPNALSLSTATASLAQLLGPALSGIVLSVFGAGVCFLLNAASFGGVILSLLFMKLPTYLPKKTNKRVIAEFAEGFSYIKNNRDIGLMVTMLAVVSLLVLPYNTVLPVFAKVVFKGDASTFGYINSFVGIGAVAGTIFLASRKPGVHLKRILFISTILMGVGLICFSQIKNFPAAMLFAAIAGYGSIAQFTISNIVVQSDAAPEMRGRTMGVLLMAIFGMLPLGSLLTGAVSERIGAPATVLFQGIIAVVIALIFIKFLTRSHKSGFKTV
ncbi:Predicted arabinose efflux permease, MFS family [Mucilaginibacter mallensis]|uniref:Predicted arabinose efflux permease, MFS family n=1 Tax=Mucilaginibacter mallensis TaxID=652787 RepID=A0A1H1SEJ8_MUCMA|nr:MFS transporter [Mucilaginibacter mallensis]SDS46351.1 Predicted arabinose efflux permease, MFS family [Mucilaginibacter mallensis]